MEGRTDGGFHRAVAGRNRVPDQADSGRYSEASVSAVWVLYGLRGLSNARSVSSVFEDRKAIISQGDFQAKKQGMDHENSRRRSQWSGVEQLLSDRVENEHSRELGLRTRRCVATA